jgi:zinc/manganese transport system substrate-binding protein
MRTLQLLLPWLLTLLLPVTAWAQIRVVATLPAHGALARDIGGDAVRVQVLTTPREDPHYVDARPDFIVALSRADLLIANGMELEVGWLPAVLTQARNARILPGARGYLDLSTFIQPMQVPVQRIDRSMGDVHPSGNPHYSFDPRTMADAAIGLGETLAILDATNATVFRDNAERLANDLRAFAEQERARFARIPAAQRQFVAYHRSFAYLSDWLDVRDIAEIEPRPGIPPSPGHVAEVLSDMRRTSTRVIVQELYYPRNTSDTLARMTNGRVVVLDGGPDFARGESYFDYVRRTSEALFDAFQAPHTP